MDDESCWALMDNGSMVNAVTSEFVEAHSLDVSPLSDLAEWYFECEWLWQTILLTLGLCCHKGSGGSGVQGYDEDQVALVIKDPSVFGYWELVILVHSDYQVES